MGCYILEKIHKSILSMQGITASISIPFVFIIKITCKILECGNKLSYTNNTWKEGKV